MSRREPRHQRRIRVRVQRAGESERQPAYSQNISAGGMFVTGAPLPPGTRVRLEVGDPPDSFAVEGVVVHAAKVVPPLDKARPSGMGVRFLQVEELLAPLLGRGGTAAAVGGAGGRGEAETVYALRIGSRRELREIYERDVVTGGLFVAGPAPPPLNTVVAVELRGEAVGEPRRYHARVVQRFEPGVGHASSLRGMWVAFTEPQRVLDELLPLIG